MGEPSAAKPDLAPRSFDDVHRAEQQWVTCDLGVTELRLKQEAAVAVLAAWSS